MIKLAQLRDYLILTRLHRPIGIYLLLWPALWALWIAAQGVPDGRVLAVFVLGTILMRSAGCVINDYADRKVDPHVARTRTRPLAAGRVTTREALSLFVLLCLASLALVSLLNALTIALSVAGVLLAMSYPFMKRFTQLPQLYLGVAFAWSVPMAFAAQTGTVPALGWLLFLAPVVWAGVYDTLYAMVDRDDDVLIGVKSTAVLLGNYDRLGIGVLQLVLFGLLWTVGWRAGLGGLYDVSLIIAAGLAVYHQYLIRHRERAACFKAFVHNHWLGLAVFAGIAADYAAGNISLGW